MNREDGSMALAMSAMVAIVAVLAIAVASVGALYAAKTQATNAADAASLAAAVATYPPAASTEPLAAARIAAEANGATVLACSCPRASGLEARTVEVVTAIRASVPVFGEVTIKSASRAEFDPRDWLGR